LSAAEGSSNRRPEAADQGRDKRLRIDKMRMLDIPKSGWSGDAVFFMIRNRQRAWAKRCPSRMALSYGVYL
jgi:hypothetical protein